MPLLLSFGVVDVALDVLGVVDDELVLPDGGVDDDVSLDAGGVPEALDELDGMLDDDDDVLLSLVLGGVDDEDDDIDPLVAGGGVVVVDEDEVEGDGVTTGGVVLLVVDGVSRLHPATPTTTPLTSNAINAVFIAISSRLMRIAPRPI